MKTGCRRAAFSSKRSTKTLLHFVGSSWIAGLICSRPKTQLRRYLSTALSVLDEVGYLPIDQRGADLLFQVISQRYERGSIVITSKKAFKQWPAIFNGDSTITAAILDHLLHHAETIVIEGSSYRMRDRIET